MSQNEPEKPPLLPWRTVHALIWLVGLYILISRGWIFPGIFVLIAISAILEGIFRQSSPRSFEVGNPVSAPVETPLIPDRTPAAVYPAPVQEHRIDLLPQYCPACNAPVRGHEVKWTGPQSANCPYCGTNLPMSKS